MPTVDRTCGRGATMTDMRTMFRLMKEGQGFWEAFEQAPGMSVSYYQENFYTLMKDYLGKAGEPGTGDLEGKMSLWKNMENLKLEVEN